MHWPPHRSLLHHSSKSWLRCWCFHSASGLASVFRKRKWFFQRGNYPFLFAILFCPSIFIFLLPSCRSYLYVCLNLSFILKPQVDLLIPPFSSICSLSAFGNITQPSQPFLFFILPPFALFFSWVRGLSIGQAGEFDYSVIVHFGHFLVIFWWLFD